MDGDSLSGRLRAMHYTQDHISCSPAFTIDPTVNIALASGWCPLEDLNSFSQ